MSGSNWGLSVVDGTAAKFTVAVVASFEKALAVRCTSAHKRANEQPELP